MQIRFDHKSLGIQSVHRWWVQAGLAWCRQCQAPTLPVMVVFLDSFSLLKAGVANVRGRVSLNFIYQKRLSLDKTSCYPAGCSL